MPPFLPRKRLRSPTPEAGPSKPSPTSQGRGKAPSRKPTLFDDLDAGLGSKRTAEQSRALVEKLAGSLDDEISLSSLSDDDFQDVPNAKRQKTEEVSDDEDEDIEFEDVQTHAVPGRSGPEPSGDLELTLRKDTRISLTNPLGTKKGPSKIERGIRVATHQVHVQMLMFHNAIRNAWLCDKEVQEILVKQLTPMAMQAVEKWRLDSGLFHKEQETPKSKEKGKAVVKDKNNARSRRDWVEPAARLEKGKVNMSGGDPIFKLLKLLLQYWQQRFRITAPGLRKLGYMSLERLDEETKSFNKDPHDPELHGERIGDINEFRHCAKTLEGSRDVGAHLFTALLRGIGIEARMVANLQPVGYGWSQNEEAPEKNPRKLKKKKGVAEGEESSSEGEGSDEEEKPRPRKGRGKDVIKSKESVRAMKKLTKRGSRGSGLHEAPIDLSDSELSDVPSEEDDDSVVDVTPARQRVQPSKPYDKDLLFPHYWTEVLSPVTNTYTAVDSVVLRIVATNPELLGKFEPRGSKADKAKQVTSYIVGHSPDGTAKDVTTRYLKRQIWPGRTKGNRITAEKIAVHNSRGKIKRYDEYDWFKTVMSAYVRGTKQCPRTEIDDHEEATDLKRVKPEKKEVEEGKETLQSYKSSPDFVLERHLKREEALLPTAKYVKTFTVKGGKGQETTEEKVFRRKDVVNCKTMETWHKEGRAPIEGEEPLKRVPYRAATTNRRRELAEAEQATGEKMLQGLYSWNQTDWIIPPPIENGIIPKNNFGNIDLYVDSMLPEGAVHIPRRGTVKICKRLGIDYAEAVTGFEFGHRMAVPIITGVVVAIENYENVMEEWEKDEEERVRKEDEKRTRVAISLWRKMLMGLRIIKRVREEYGDDVGEEADILNPWTNKKKGKEVDQDLEARRRIMEQRDEDMAGGFLPEGHDEEEVEAHHSESFFPVAHDDGDEGGGFMVEGHDEPTKVSNAYPTPQSLQSPSKIDLAESEEKDAKGVDSESEEAPASRKRGKPFQTVKKFPRSNNSTPASTKSKTPAKRAPARKKTPASKSNGKSERQLAASELEDDGESPLSDLESDESASELKEVPNKAAKSRRATMLAGATENPRRMPKRNAARKSETALKSHYFEHSDDEDDE